MALALEPTSGVPWLAFGLVLAIAEVLDGNFVLFSLGLGFALTSIAAFGGVDSIGALLGICAAAQLVVFGAVRPVVLRKLMPRERTPTNTEALIGRPGVVQETIGAEDRPGYVRVGGESWRAVSGDGRSFDPGTQVKVLAMSGVTLTVAAEGPSEATQ